MAVEEQPGSESVIDANDILVKTEKESRLNGRGTGLCEVCLLKDHGRLWGEGHHNNSGSGQNPRYLLS